MALPHHRRPLRLSPRAFRYPCAAAALLLSLASSGCLSSLSKRSAALASATAPVVDQAAAAYQDAAALHDLRVDYDAVAQFDIHPPVYNPRNIQPLLTAKDIEVRLAVLAALQAYSRTLVAITAGTDSPALDAAAKSVGQNLTSLGNAVAPSIENTLGLAPPPPASKTQTTVTTTTGSTTSSVTSNSSTSSPAISSTAQTRISTAANVLAQFLVGRKIKKDLPQIIRRMDPHIQALCDLLEKDIDTLHDVETLDYDFILDKQTLFIRTAQIDPEQHREQIMKLPEIVRQQRAADQKILDLKASIDNLAKAHTALLAAADGTPESLKSKLADLEAAGESFGKFYTSLSAK